MSPAPVPTSLADEQRAVARERILLATKLCLTRTGLDTTVDDVADAAGISRRTVFRHFGTREHLLASAIRSGLAGYVEHVPLADPADDVRAWLTAVLHAAHRVNALNGRIYWDLLVPGSALTGELGEVAEERREGTRKVAEHVAATLWKAGGGGRRRPPRWFHDAVAVHVSGFTTQALGGDFDRSPDEVAAASVHVLEAALAAALATGNAAGADRQGTPA